MKPYKSMTNEELLNEYEGIKQTMLFCAYGKSEIMELEAIEYEMTKREE